MRADDPDKAAQLHEEIHAHVPSEPALRVKALESLLVEKGLVNSGAIDAWLEIYRDQVGPKLGARASHAPGPICLQDPTAGQWDRRH